jgi:hypothetical protein
MKRIFAPVFLLLALMLGSQVPPARAQGGIRVVSDQISLQFPDTATFTAKFSSGAKINSIVLEYGVEQLNCGTVVAKSFPEFTPGKDVTVEWTWEMLQSGSLPPGATLWWQWQVTDLSGAKFTSPKKTTIWLDDLHGWKTISGGNINLHYYDNSASFGQELHDAAAAALTRLFKEVGLRPSKPVDIYIYANTEDMKAAILYEPTWVGGQAFIEHNIIIIGVTPDEMDWGKSTEAHELTHVLVGEMTFTCLGFIPTWLVEGLAMVGEGGLDAYQQQLLDQAIADNTLPSLQALTGGFSEEGDRARLSYAVSYSVTNYLVKTYGQIKMNTLLLSLRDGNTIDDALKSVYGLNVDGLDAAWRQSIGATALSGGSLPTPVPTPTNVPTIVPFSGVPVTSYTPSLVTPSISTSGATPTPNPRSEPSATPSGKPTMAQRLGISQELLLVISFTLLCVLIVIAAVIGLILITLRRKHRRQP